ncbi:ANTAR domain-containing protein [Lentzea tibetensis]|uniref:ANTAR domain-containing protein n=1 Tax=Lentzea tibetensis TaxID=2591470 RepID=A0A563EKM0_9PSEU|nr:ANTAR domain-containing protein [Lentzea tibetensis]TWP47581.1 ANTAR domain-containing protein [Lentzea tibetensis]
MTAQHFSLDEFLGMVVRGVARDLPGLLGTDIAALRPRQPHHSPVVLAAHGVSLTLHEIQLRAVRGPIRVAATADGPVVSEDLWHDERWPELRLKQACTQFPDQSRVLHETRGVVSLPGLHDNGSVVVLSAYLAEAPGTGAVSILSRYERLVASAIVTTSAFTGPPRRTGRALAILQSRDDVQQATGIVMSLCRTDPVTAGRLLHDIGLRADVRPDALAAELVRMAGDPGEKPGAAPAPDPRARRIAVELWSALSRNG